jgi:diguanylate cyclase (GGDEF)-like protein
MSQMLSGENSGIALATLHELLTPDGQHGSEVVDLLVAEVLKEMERYSDVLNVDARAICTPAEIYARAMSHLSEIATTLDEPMMPGEAVPSEIEWLKERVNDLADQLTRDPMTSIRNRAFFDSQLERRIALARLMNSHVAVLFVDVNKFKQINDNYGHDVGDAAIRQVADDLSQAIRTNDILARYGGDEFVILCEMNSADGLTAQAHRLSEGTSALRVPHSGGELLLSLAVGGAIGMPDRDSGFKEKLMQAADHAMYTAKRERTGPVVISLGLKSTNLTQPPHESFATHDLVIA